MSADREPNRSVVERYAGLMAEGDPEIGFLDPDEPVTLGLGSDPEAGQQHLNEHLREQAAKAPKIEF